MRLTLLVMSIVVVVVLATTNTHAADNLHGFLSAYLPPTPKPAVAQPPHYPNYGFKSPLPSFAFKGAFRDRAFNITKSTYVPAVIIETPDTFDEQEKSQRLNNTNSQYKSFLGRQRIQHRFRIPVIDTVPRRNPPTTPPKTQKQELIFSLPTTNRKRINYNNQANDNFGQRKFLLPTNRKPTNNNNNNDDAKVAPVYEIETSNPHDSSYAYTSIIGNDEGKPQGQTDYTMANNRQYRLVKMPIYVWILHEYLRDQQH